jgi:hypothetical protein
VVEMDKLHLLHLQYQPEVEAGGITIQMEDLEDQGEVVLIAVVEILLL